MLPGAFAATRVMTEPSCLSAIVRPHGYDPDEQARGPATRGWTDARGEDGSGPTIREGFLALLVVASSPTYLRGLGLYSDIARYWRQPSSRGLFIQWQAGEKVVIWPDDVAMAEPRFPTSPWDQRRPRPAN